MSGLLRPIVDQAENARGPFYLAPKRLRGFQCKVPILRTRTVRDLMEVVQRIASSRGTVPSEANPVDTGFDEIMPDSTHL